jgi:hypothetical protein
MALRECQMFYLVIRNEHQGKQMFGASAAVDWYVLQKTPITKCTVVNDEHEKIYRLNLKGIPFIPNFKMVDLCPLLTSDEKQTVDFIYDSSTYHTQ